MARRTQIEPVTRPVDYRERWARLNREYLPFWLLLLIILLGGGLLLLATARFFPALAGLDELPYAIHSPLEADYSADFRQTPFASVNLHLLADALKDGPGDSSGARLAVLIDNLNTPVPSITPQFSSGIQPLPTQTSVRTTTTPGAAPATQDPSETPRLTASPTPTLTATGTATVPVVVPPTATSGANQPPVVLPSATRLPPTAVPPTAVPPTQTPPPTALPRDYPPPGSTVYPPP